MVDRIVRRVSCGGCEGRCDASNPHTGWRNVYCEFAEKPYSIEKEFDEKGKFPPFCPLEIDPVFILEAWIDAYDRGGMPHNNVQQILQKDLGDCTWVDVVKAMMKELNERPQLVIERGKKEGWLNL